MSEKKIENLFEDIDEKTRIKHNDDDDIICARSSSVNIFKVIDDSVNHNYDSLLESVYTRENIEKCSPFLINRWLSGDIKYVRTALMNDMFNIPPYNIWINTRILSKKIKPCVGYSSKDKKDNTITCIAKYYNISENVAYKYSKILSNKDIQKIVSYVKLIMDDKR